MKRSRKNRVVVVGSVNADFTVDVDRFPQPNETILGFRSVCTIGGKGANQAVAASRMGSNTSLIAKVGSDHIAEMAINHLEAENVNTTHVYKTDKVESGLAHILVSQSGDNTIVVSPGANSLLTPDDVEAAESTIAEAYVMVVQLEIPMQTVEKSLLMAKKHDVLAILNPAPMTHQVERFIHLADVITPNETEAAQLIKSDALSEQEIAKAIYSMGVATSIVTLGKRGSYIHSSDLSQRVPSPSVNCVNSAGAGDVFNGVLSAKLASGMVMIDALRIATKAGAYSVTQYSIGDSAPTASDLVKQNTAS